MEHREPRILDLRMGRIRQAEGQQDHGNSAQRVQKERQGVGKDGSGIGAFNRRRVCGFSANRSEGRAICGANTGSMRTPLENEDIRERSGAGMRVSQAVSFRFPARFLLIPGYPERLQDFCRYDREGLIDRVRVYTRLMDRPFSGLRPSNNIFHARHTQEDLRRQPRA